MNQLIRKAHLKCFELSKAEKGTMNIPLSQSNQSRASETHSKPTSEPNLKLSKPTGYNLLGVQQAPTWGATGTNIHKAHNAAHTAVLEEGEEILINVFYYT